MQKKKIMKFADVISNQKLWAVIYDGDSADILSKTLSAWLNPKYLREFFAENASDLATYFHITNIDQAIYDTVSDAMSLSCLILDIKPDADLDRLFRPLENHRIQEMIFSREKAKGSRVSGHPSWLRLYAIKLEKGIYLVTGGTIKLTHSMNERQHTIDELIRMEKVRNYLLFNGISDVEGLESINNEQ